MHRLISNSAIYRFVFILFCLTAFTCGHPRKAPDKTNASPLYEKGIIAGPTSEYSHPRYVCLARLLNNDILAVFAGMGTDDPDNVAIWSCYSTDNGKTWSKPVIAVDTPEYMDCDPNIVVCKDRVLVVATTRKARELIWTKFPFSTSRDNGRTWEPGDTIDHFHNYSSGKLQAATRLRNGRLLMPFCWDVILDKQGSVIKDQAERNMISVSSVLYSDDDGHTWKAGGDLDISEVPGGGGINGLDEICIAELSDGSVYALCRTGVDRLYEARSSDHGMTWSKPIPSPLVACNAPASMIRLDKPEGTIVAVWNETAKNDRKPLVVAYSSDDCKTWSESKIIFNDYSPYPGIVQAADGCIIASWFQNVDGGTAIGFARFNPEWLMTDKTFRLIHNNDGTDALGNYWFNNRPLSVEDINAYVDMVANSQVTTYMMCSGSDFLYYRSQFGNLFCDDLNGTLDCGKDTAAFKIFNRYYRNFLNLEKEGTDLISASLNRAKKNGMEAFITYRMNDLHFTDTTRRCPIVYSDFWIRHPQYWMNDASEGWHSEQALDFTFKEVRDHKLRIISEQLDKYDMIDGFDLDFMRFIVYFKKGEGRTKAPLMTQLVKDVRAKVEEVSKTRGKKILLSVRVPLTVDACLDKGLDIKEWIRLNLIDFITIGVHWKGVPSIPVEKFKEDLGNPDIPLYATIDDGGYSPRETFSHGMFRGMASHILSQGADGIYLFNQYYGPYMSTYNKQTHLEEGGYVCRVIMPQLLHEIGSLETLKQRNKIYCLSDGSTEYGVIPPTPLPLKVKSDSMSIAEIYIGDDPLKTIPEEIILFLRLNKPSTFDLYVNGIKTDKEQPGYVNLYDKARGLGETDQVYAFIVPASSLKQRYNKISFKARKTDSFIVKRLEIAMKYGDVETHGYF